MITNNEDARKLQQLLHLYRIVQETKTITPVHGAGVSMQEDAMVASRRLLRKAAKELFPSAEVTLLPQYLVIKLISRQSVLINSITGYRDPNDARQKLGALPRTQLPDGREFSAVETYTGIQRLTTSGYPLSVYRTGQLSELRVACSLRFLRAPNRNFSAHMIQAMNNMRSLKGYITDFLSVYPTFEEAITQGASALLEQERQRHQTQINEAMAYIDSLLGIAPTVAPIVPLVAEAVVDDDDDNNVANAEADAWNELEIIEDLNATNEATDADEDDDYEEDDDYDEDDDDDYEEDAEDNEVDDPDTGNDEFTLVGDVIEETPVQPQSRRPAPLPEVAVDPELLQRVLRARGLIA